MKQAACTVFLLAAPFLFADPVVEAGSGLEVSLWADETQVANPVCIAIDERNRVFVGESFRQSKGIEDNRSHGYWLLDDLAARKVEDRRALIEKWAAAGKKPLDYFTAHEDRITRLADTDGDGRADQRSVYADGFDDALDGTGAGLIARDGELWYTCIPKLWRFRDADDDGVADEKAAISEGYGVRWALRGHDLHGLCWGPDGRLYFSIGDRGYHVTTMEGNVLHDPGSGAVFRCEPDGAGLEVFFRGLRNPQELAFDARGNLFTGDNNSDAGDKARVMYLPEGGWMGWQMAYQTLAGDYSRGPWHMDKLWHNQHEGQPAWIVPSLAHVSSGPSGFAHYPGVGLPARYDNHFLLADFRGGEANSGVWAFECKEKGAGFEVVDVHMPIRNVLVTDVDFTTDGRIMLSDWINGWNGTDKGRIWSVHHPESRRDQQVALAKAAFEQGFKTLTDTQLAGLLRARDQRVRQRAQFALADRAKEGGLDDTVRRILLDAVRQTDLPLTRLHGIWGIEQITRGTGEATPLLAPLLGDDDPDVLCQTLRVLGSSSSGTTAAEAMLALLEHRHARVRATAAMELGRLGHRPALPGILRILRDNNDADPFLRHGCVMGLTFLGDADALLAVEDGHRSVRLGLVLALRRLGDARIAKFLGDPDEFVAAETARAIYDVPIPDAMPALADALSAEAQKHETFVRRAVAANLRLGGAERAARLADYAVAVPGKPAEIALAALEQWTRPNPREPVHGHFVPLEPRPAGELRAAAARHIDAWLRAGGRSQEIALRIAKRADVPLGDRQFSAIALDTDKPAANRVEAIQGLAQRGGVANLAVLESLLEDRDLDIRAATMKALVGPAPERALAVARSKIERGQPTEQQAAADTLALLGNAAADQVLESAMRRLVGGTLKPELTLDLLAAAKVRKLDALVSAWEASLDPNDPLARHRPALRGGRPESGAAIFKGHAAAQCARCHATADGHEAEMIGPNLHGVAARLPPEELLRSVIEPSANIAEGFGVVTVTRKDGETVSGTLRSDQDGVLVIKPAEGPDQRIPAADVASRSQPVSAMPPMGSILQPRELRDLIAFLRTLK